MMDRSSVHDGSRRRARVIALLVVYALFLVLPGVHGLMHDHGGDLAVAASVSGPPVAVSACGGDCEHPLHDHHEAHGDACPVCQLASSTKSFWRGAPTEVPATLFGSALIAAGAPRARVFDDLRLARGPPLRPRFDHSVFSVVA